MVRWFLSLTLAGLLSISVVTARGESIASKSDTLAGRSDVSAALAAATPKVGEVAGLDLGVAPEVMMPPNSASIAIPLSSIAGRSFSNHDDILLTDMGSSELPVMSPAYLLVQRASNLFEELVYFVGHPRLNLLAARVAGAKSPLLLFMSTGLVGIFFRTRILRERRATLALSQ
ncbi:hypothetical protein [Singulisphaera sp. PoT]|uniref:hypothetical protein n=1 Tax=Singulisphaera sp. PoT TaxID=3411797 RepID=UPI003BF51DFA